MSLTQKSRGTSFLLTLLLGPLGLLYSSMAGGIILIVVAISTAATIIGPIVCWVLAMIIGDISTQSHNKGIQDFKDSMTNQK